MTKRIAMWSGPRNISTAMMRAWGSRGDAVVCDEPLYAYYLKQTGYTHHPGYLEVLAHQESNWEAVVDALTIAPPSRRQISYQKHMAHHLVGPNSIAWTDNLTNVFLVRDPREVLLSLTKVIPMPTLDETGLPQQVKLFERVKSRNDETPIVLDAKNVLLDPEGVLRQLCERLEVPFMSEMLNWQPGTRETDGVWAKHWYENVSQSTTFAPYRPRKGDLPEDLLPLLGECEALYDSLIHHRLVG